MVDAYPGLIEIREGKGGRLLRFSDVAPHWGGAWVESPGHGHCSSGFTVKDNSTGARYMVTAAHCANGVGSDVFGGSSIFWGTIAKWGPFPTWDIAMINGSHNPRIYVGNNGPTSAAVAGAANPAVGSTSYCHSGSTTFEHCGHHCVSLTGSFCDPQGNCTQLLAVFQDGVQSQAGDSGSPMYNYPGSGGVTIRGVLIAGSGNTMYAEKWNQVNLQYNASIVIGT